jgi:CheY-like chemotaxis protein
MKAHRITIVDDNPDSLSLPHRMILRLYPKSSIATFSNAEDALAHILGTGTELLTISQFMRKMTGAQLILDLRLRERTMSLSDTTSERLRRNSETKDFYKICSNVKRN